MIVENIRQGMSQKDACVDALKRIARDYGAKLEKFDINFYLRKDGVFAGASLWCGVQRRGAGGSRQFAVADRGKARLEKTACIYWSVSKAHQRRR